MLSIMLCDLFLIPAAGARLAKVNEIFIRFDSLWQCDLFIRFEIFIVFVLKESQWPR